jgi:hypothetical protein
MQTGNVPGVFVQTAKPLFLLRNQPTGVDSNGARSDHQRKIRGNAEVGAGHCGSGAGADGFVVGRDSFGRC